MFFFFVVVVNMMSLLSWLATHKPKSCVSFQIELMRRNLIFTNLGGEGGGGFGLKPGGGVCSV